MARKPVFWVVVVIALVMTAGIGASYEKLNIPVKKFLASPTEEAKSVFDFPVNVRITGRTPDKKWYKIRLSYNFIGYYEYEGWIKVE